MKPWQQRWSTRWLLLWWLCFGWLAAAQAAGTDLTLGGRYWLDPGGAADIEAVSRLAPSALSPLDTHRAFDLSEQALWIQPPLPGREPQQRWYLALSAAAFVDSATLYQRLPDGRWTQQIAGDAWAVQQWTHPDQTPVFLLEPNAQASDTWLRLTNRPSPTSPRLQLLSERELQAQRYWTLLLVGAYLGLGTLVLFLGLVHGRLYRDRAFLAYCSYVGAMLAFQLAFTGVGGLFFWDESPRWNDAAPALFMMGLTALGIWFVRESCALARYSRTVDRLVLGWIAVGLVLLPGLYFALYTPTAFRILNLYGLASVLLSMGLCLWAWRQRMPYALWLFFGFLPLHLSYPFPALRSVGLLPDSGWTQYALMIGSAIEIPLLLFILHRRARDLHESAVRLRALDSTDPLTGLALLPVLHLRLRDALRRARRQHHRLGVAVVELSNHADIVAEFGREAGDKAIVVAASRLSEVVREVDTVSRLAHTRFAVLVEGPQAATDIRLLAQHMVARGLEKAPLIGPQVSLRLRIATAMPPDGVMDVADGALVDEQRLLARLGRALDHFQGDPRKVVLHLPLPTEDARSSLTSAPPSGA